MPVIRYACACDLSFWRQLDPHLPETLLLEKFQSRCCYIAEVNDERCGILRFNLAWDNTPFCTHLYIHPRFQRQGLGKAMMRHWEQDMKQQGYGLIMVSTQVDEDAQHFYRKIGYKDIGGIILDFPGYEQPMEMFMAKLL